MKQSHYRALLSLGLPIVIGQIGVIILGFADTLMVGHHSSTELAAASFVNNMCNLAIIFSTGFAYGLTPVVGRLFGEGKKEKIGEVLRNSLSANTLLALIVCGIMFTLYLNIHRLGQPEELIPYMRPYFIVLLLSLPFVMWFNAFKQFSDGITDTKVSMWILLCGNVLNIIGNYILIYGKLGLPELGLLGAGISTLVSRILMVIAYLVLFSLPAATSLSAPDSSPDEPTGRTLPCSTAWGGPLPPRWAWKPPHSASVPSWWAGWAVPNLPPTRS